MKVTKRTPRVDMVYKGMGLKAGEFYKEVAAENGVDIMIVDEALGKFFDISLRVQFAKGEVDFPLAERSDSPDALREKFNKFLDSECDEKIEMALRAIRDMDRPSDQATSPTLPEEASKN